MGPCDICGQEPQRMQIGNMETGDQLFVCTGCFARFGLDFAKKTLPPEEVAQLVGPMFVAPPITVEQNEAAAEANRPRRKSKAKAKTAEGEAGGSPEVATTAANE